MAPALRVDLDNFSNSWSSHVTSNFDASRRDFITNRDQQFLIFLRSIVHTPAEYCALDIPFDLITRRRIAIASLISARISPGRNDAVKILSAILKSVPGLLGAILLAAAPALAKKPAPIASACQLGNGVQHVVYVEFDNVHFTRDNPNVPSDLEQMPHLLNFIKQNGTLDTGDHAVLISHTANDILTTQTGLYSDNIGILIANSFLEFEPGSPANIFVVSSFFYWTDTVANIVAATMDNTPALTTPEGKNVPAPWVPFTRAGCDVGAFSTANIVLERTPFDVDKVYGAGSTQATEDDPACHSAHPSCPHETDDFIGAAIHCANGSQFCTKAAGNPNVVEVADSLPDEPGGYSGYEALFGLKYIAPALGGLTDYNGNAITGFAQLNFSPTTAQTLAVVETMLKKGIPVVFAYIADAHDNHAGPGTYGPGQAAYVQQLKDYDTAFGKFFADLKAAGMDQTNTLFIFTPDEGDHFVGGAPSPANCDGVTTACTYPPGPPPTGPNPGVGEIDLDLNKVVTDAGNVTPFTYHFDDAATVFVPWTARPHRSLGARARTHDGWPDGRKSAYRHERELAWHWSSGGSAGSAGRSGGAKAAPHGYQGGSERLGRFRAPADFHLLRQSEFLL